MKSSSSDIVAVFAYGQRKSTGRSARCRVKGSTGDAVSVKGVQRFKTWWTVLCATEYRMARQTTESDGSSNDDWCCPPIR
jgi:hypothetical protein